MNAYLILDPRFIHLRSFMTSDDQREHFRGWLAQALRRLPGVIAESLAVARRQRQAKAMLSAMDDRLLNDIGISRGEIDEVVRGLTAKPREMPAPTRATVYTLETTDAAAKPARAKLPSAA